MFRTAEAPLIASAIALALVALACSLPVISATWRRAAAVAIGTLGAAGPLIAYAARGASPATTGRALWEWTAVGGPTIKAAYAFDGLAAIGIALVVAFGSAGLLAVTRASTRRPLLPGLVLAIGLVGIALHVTTDLIASIVLLGVIAALTAFVMLLVAPAPASARLATFLAIGIQAFVVAALLVSRFGASSFRFDEIRPIWISPGVVLAASAGAALFAGLYPFVPWRFERGEVSDTEREPLRGLLAMPVGIAGSLVLLRLLGTTRIALDTLALPELDPLLRSAVVVAIVVATALRATRGRSRGLIAVGALTAIAALAYPALHWSHVVLACALVTVLYASAVSLSSPDDWSVVRHDVALAGLWIGFALGTPIAIASGLALLVAEAGGAMAERVWMPPHRVQIVLVATSVATVAAIGGMAVGVTAATDTLTQALALLTVLALLALELVHIGRRLSFAIVPTELDVTAAAAAFLGTLLVVLLLALPMHDTLDLVGRPVRDVGSWLAMPALITLAIVVVLIARSVRPFLPDLTPLGGRLTAVVTALDPVPAAMSAFGVVAATSTRVSTLFALFERRGGVWLAMMLIIGLLVWATRS